MVGHELETAGNDDAAEEAYHRAIERGENWAVSYVGGILERRGDLQGAESAYRHADALGSSDGAMRLGELLLRGGDLNEAESAFARMELRSSGFVAATAAFYLGVIRYKAGDLAAAEIHYRRADAGGSPSASYNLGLLLERLGNLEEAESALLRAHERGHERGLASAKRVEQLRAQTGAQLTSPEEVAPAGNPATELEPEEAASTSAAILQFPRQPGSHDLGGPAVKRSDVIEAAFAVQAQEVVEELDDSLLLVA